MLKENPALLWKDVRFKDKCRAMDDTNSQFRLDEVSEVEMDLIGWRYSRVFESMRHAEGV
jgi:hypothetical protein